MATNTAHRHANGPTSLPAGLLARAADQVRQFFCGLHGHDALLHFEQTRVSLQCSSCGYETPGWDLKASAASDAVQAANAAQRTPRVVRLPFMRERRVA